MTNQKSQSENDEREEAASAATLTSLISDTVADELDLEGHLKLRIERRVSDILSRRYEPGDILSSAAVNNLLDRLDFLEGRMQELWDDHIEKMNESQQRPLPPKDPGMK